MAVVINFWQGPNVGQPGTSGGPAGILISGVTTETLITLTPGPVQNPPLAPGLRTEYREMYRDPSGQWQYPPNNGGWLTQDTNGNYSFNPQLTPNDGWFGVQVVSFCSDPEIPNGNQAEYQTGTSNGSSVTLNDLFFSNGPQAGSTYNQDNPDTSITINAVLSGGGGM